MSNDNNSVDNTDILNNPIYQEAPTPENAPAHYFVPQKIYGSSPALLRVGFKLPIPKRYADDTEYVQDPRPIYWPVFHPYHVVKQEHDHLSMMAYVVEEEDVLAAWPHAEEITIFDNHATEYLFSKVFPKPDWLDVVWDDGFVPAAKKVGVFVVKLTDMDLMSIGFSDDIEYDIQLNCHQLEYGTHQHAELQQAYDEGAQLEVELHETTSLNDAELLAKRMVAFNNAEDGDLPTELLE